MCEHGCVREQKDRAALERREGGGGVQEENEREMGSQQ